MSTTTVFGDEPAGSGGGGHGLLEALEPGRDFDAGEEDASAVEDTGGLEVDGEAGGGDGG